MEILHYLDNSDTSLNEITCTECPFAEGRSPLELLCRLNINGLPLFLGLRLALS